MRKQRLKLSTLIIIVVCIVVLFSLLITSVLISNTIKDTIHKTTEEKAEVIGKTVAQSEVVQLALKKDDDGKRVQAYASEIQRSTDVSFIVVMDMKGIRRSHPNEDLIGKHFKGGDEREALHGHVSSSISKGTLGESLRSFTPVYADGKQVGVVTVGVPMKSVSEALADGNKKIIIGSIIGLIVGAIGAYLLSRYIKRILLGLEPHHIAKILGERNTMLQSVHEGIVAVDKEGNINLVNKSAMDIFKRAGLKGNPIGMHINDYMNSTQLPKVLELGKPERDKEQNINGIKILVNRVPLTVNNETVGAISTFRDKTEVNKLSEQLVGVRTYADTLRAQSHEFSNRLHVISGMLQMEHYDDLKQYIHEIVELGSQESGDITSKIKDAVLAGFLIGKLSLAREQNIKLSIINDTIIPEPNDSHITHEMITIIGNLIDNSIESLVTSSVKKKTIDVHLKYDNGHLIIDVIDSGLGLKDELDHQIFEKGFSSKGENRGYGLHLVQQSIEKLNGHIKINANEEGNVQFSVVINYPKKEENKC
ncbi:DcuS/MalK family sensor histidine kinase [Mammaliicoccus vitulinus]|uniref:DcuS/MalK family sensor histidine kinase n=1 Tax=Mammaliicoccus vitulinus TaxID=71237 RepID=UPI0002F1F348|nr:DcuS/MalK family sensor histidine kinase [Mammaliicoccus vitulinus]MBO3077469.1 DcuS/MalK family sensor histidine kinase [Mammaliicoccus vitulinus]